jgi:Protein of unknown function (DUF3570)
MAASCALLGAGAARSQETRMAPPNSGLLEDWSVDSALAYYHEDGRIQAIEPVVDVSKIFADGQALNFNVTFDALSGASPNGALTSRMPQTFTSPSGKPQHRYTTAQVNCRSTRAIAMTASRWAATGPCQSPGSIK